ncbi:MAG TPA: class I SAM-dependent methyltransferase [Dehalococcoidia bacterium]|nr:class I SAM-dependent methyltransferase [Dehalococcoidia bacterium]
MNNNRSNWDSHWGEESQREYWQEPAGEIIKLKDSLDRQKVRDVLDLGCGIGRHAILFAELGFNVAAVDDSRKALDIFKKMHTKNR